METKLISKEEARELALERLAKRKETADRVVKAAYAGVVVGSVVGGYLFATNATQMTVVNGTFVLVAAPLWLKIITFVFWTGLFIWLGHLLIKFCNDLFNLVQLDDYLKAEDM